MFPAPILHPAFIPTVTKYFEFGMRKNTEVILCRMQQTAKKIRIVTKVIREIRMRRELCITL